ncbi:hypothetical protein BKA60DRAFT_585231 [Fusarium oxysporum]|nr:hypothetical protein BKA60DRAFT_585231 [Fusarium oxysporum]
MANAAVLKSQAQKCLTNTVDALRQRINSPTMQDLSALPPAFTGAAKSLSRFSRVLDSFETSLEKTSSDTQSVEKYITIRNFSQGCASKVQAILNLFDVIIFSTDWEKAYLEEVNHGDGKLVEEALIDLLESANCMANRSYLGDKEAGTLKSLLKDAEALPTSLKEKQKSPITLTNHGSGSMFYHGGRGHQNQYNARFQNNGPSTNARFNYKEDPEELKDEKQ